MDTLEDLDQDDDEDMEQEYLDNQEGELEDVRKREQYGPVQEMPIPGE